MVATRITNGDGCANGIRRRGIGIRSVTTAYRAVKEGDVNTIAETDTIAEIDTKGLRLDGGVEVTDRDVRRLGQSGIARQIDLSST
jgi:hypothetical protein